MSSGQHSDQSTALEGVSHVAWQALSTIVPAGPVDPMSRVPMESYLKQMLVAVLSQKTSDLTTIIKSMRRARITSAIIAEVYVPTVARRLGEGWIQDTLDFSAVTIGSARLQGILWLLEKDWAVPRENRMDCPPAFLIGVPQGVQHTLGATILAGQLRHRGMSVHLDLEMTPASITEHVHKQELSGVLLSSSGCEHLDTLKSLVDMSRHQSRKTPVIIGGAILEQTDDLLKRTGADFVTSDVHEVLQYCETQAVATDVPYVRGQEIK